jgi:SPP1 gp7 family putative phage head morphogenesis protein
MSEEIVPTALPFEEAADYFRQKVNLPTAAWTDLREGMHARAFVVAGATKAALLSDFREALQVALDEGETLRDFRKRFDDIVKRHGWTHNGTPGWRSRVIYDTNLRMAHAAGRWSQIDRLTAQGTKVYLRYSAILDQRTRPQHRGWNDVVLPADHDFWKTHYPPNGWRCRCSVQVLPERSLARYGLKVTPPPPNTAPQPRTVNTPNGPVSWPTPPGIDAGFGYNVGRAAFGQRLDEATMAAWRKHGGSAWRRLTDGDWRAAGRPARLPVDPASARPTGNPADDPAGFVAEQIGGESVVLKTPDGDALTLTASVLADHVPADRLPYMTELKETVTDPAEIWMAFEQHEGTGRVRLVKRLVRAVDVGGDRYMILVAQTAGGRFEGWTVIPTSKAGYARQQRVGQLLWARPE